MESLSYTLEVKDQKNEELFGGVLVVLTGDFRQILPVAPGGTKADELDASIKSSFLWEHVKTLKLTKNMRVHLTGDTEAAEFAEILEDIGNGELGRDTQGIVGFPPDKITLSPFLYFFIKKSSRFFNIGCILLFLFNLKPSITYVTIYKHML